MTRGTDAEVVRSTMVGPQEGDRLPQIDHEVTEMDEPLILDAIDDLAEMRPASAGR